MFKRILLAGAAALLMNVSAAQADLMTVEGISSLNQTETTHIAGQLADNLTVYAGPEQILYQNTQYLGYCVDLNHYAGTSQVTEVSALTWPNGNKLVYLYDTYAPTVTTSLQAAALQTAIWEVISEPAAGPFDVTKGNFYITGNDAVATLANQWLATLPSTYNPTQIPTILDSSANQSFLVGKWEGVNNPVPEPCTMALLAVGGSCLLLVARRKGRHSVVAAK